jgi:hypothetical protein
MLSNDHFPTLVQPLPDHRGVYRSQHVRQTRLAKLLLPTLEPHGKGQDLTAGINLIGREGREECSSAEIRQMDDDGREGMDVESEFGKSGIVATFVSLFVFLLHHVFLVLAIAIGWLVSVVRFAPLFEIFLVVLFVLAFDLILRVTFLPIPGRRLSVAIGMRQNRSVGYARCDTLRSLSRLVRRCRRLCRRRHLATICKRREVDSQSSLATKFRSWLFIPPNML